MIKWKSSLLYLIRISRGDTMFMKNKKGFTLIELVVTIAMLVVVVGAIFSYFIFEYKSYNKGVNLQAAQADTRLALDYVVKNTRNAVTLSYNPASVALDEYKIYLSSNRIYLQQNQGGTLVEIGHSGRYIDTLTFTGNGYTLTISAIGSYKGETFTVSTEVLMQNMKIAETALTSGPGSSIKFTK